MLYFACNDRDLVERQRFSTDSRIGIHIPALAGLS
jgi:hypothetical protein